MLLNLFIFKNFLISIGPVSHQALFLEQPPLHFRHAPATIFQFMQHTCNVEALLLDYEAWTLAPNTTLTLHADTLLII